MNHECKQLKAKILDQSNQEIFLEIKLALSELKEMRKTIDCLETDHTKVTENLTKLQNSNLILQTDYSKVKETLQNVKASNSILEAKHSKVLEEVDILKDTVPWNIKGIFYLFRDYC